MFSKSKPLIITTLLLLVFVLAGCSSQEVKDNTLEKLNWLNQKLDDVFEEEGEITNDSSAEEDSVSHGLSSEDKREIDKWLEDNDLNRYGDSGGVIYQDGSPLYNRETGEQIDRYDYILERYPDILERINNNNEF